MIDTLPAGTTLGALMRSTVEPAEGNKVKVSVEVDEAELEPAVEAAWREIAKEVRLPGFRPGKAPRRLLEKQLGGEYARSEALKNALPEFYGQAVIDHDVDVVAAPELDITSGEDEGPVAFSAVVEIRPEVQVAGYDGLRVVVPSPEASDDEVTEQIDRLRSQYGELTVVERAARDQDYVTIDISGTQDGEAVDGLTADDYQYLIGSGAIASEFDENLTGAKAGDILEFDAEHPDPDADDVHFRLLVKNVQERVLPDLSDEWVADATEFETVAELLEDTRSRISEGRVEQTRLAVRSNLGTELARLVDIDIPEAMVSSEMQMRLQNLAYQLQSSGIGLDDYVRMTGRDPETFTAELKTAAEEAVRVDLALRAVAGAEGIEASDEEVAEEVSRDARRQRPVPRRGDGAAAYRRTALGGTLGRHQAQGAGVARGPERGGRRRGQPGRPELLEPPERHDHEHDHDHDDPHDDEDDA